MTYLKMPLQLQSAVAKKLQRCSYQESIAQHIMLLILSHHGEVIGREDFGSMIWDLEFNQLVKISDWEEGVKNSLQILQHPAVAVLQSAVQQRLR